MATTPAPNSLGAAVAAVAWVFAALAIVTVAARFYVRLKIVRKLFRDDYVILVTFTFAIINSAFVTISVWWGLGHHISALVSHPERVTNAVKWMFLSEIFAIMSPGFGRISFAFLLLGLLPPSGPRSLRPMILWSIIAIQFVVDLGTVIISLVQCRPIVGFWDKSIEAGCWDPRVQQYAGFLQGLALSAVMGLSIIAMVASIVRTVKLQAITETDDQTYAMAEAAIWWTAGNSILTDSHNMAPFDRLWEHNTFLNDISCGDDGSSGKVNTYCMDPDITVSVTLGHQSPDVLDFLATTHPGCVDGTIQPARISHQEVYHNLDEVVVLDVQFAFGENDKLGAAREKAASQSMLLPDFASIADGREIDSMYYSHRTFICLQLRRFVGRDLNSEIDEDVTYCFTTPEDGGMRHDLVSSVPILLEQKQHVDFVFAVQLTPSSASMSGLREGRGNFRFCAETASAGSAILFMNWSATVSEKMGFTPVNTAP
ncbi:hypothetical protein J7T55_007662 [Diaporthe amygdali]|uniref:uncharacterized protein n=1 Tax=Phomopsis amygdali TaxID=1214568 RepID=UPI0022FDE9BD|nr:uncharacterized protein J7T55_007662 [Diaporthe amygdali]KAJ0107473.1 hypothetical protein J7T55_007662 [Diaporthe amygdali]